MAEVATVEAPETLRRVARLDTPTRWSEISPVDASSSRSGNRYDVLGGGVLYCASETFTCYAETLARFRPSPAMRDLLSGHDRDEEHFMVVGGVPRDWRLRRRVFELRLSTPLPFLDIEDMGTLTVLEREMSSVLVSLGYEGNVDIADVRNKDRQLSRSIARWAYVAQSDLGEPLYSGIRYLSRVDPTGECWAVFDGTEVDVVAEHVIDATDQDLLRLVQAWDVRLF